MKTNDSRLTAKSKHANLNLIVPGLILLGVAGVAVIVWVATNPVLGNAVLVVYIALFCIAMAAVAGYIQIKGLRPFR